MSDTRPSPQVPAGNTTTNINTDQQQQQQQQPQQQSHPQYPRNIPSLVRRPGSAINLRRTTTNTQNGGQANNNNNGNNPTTRYRSMLDVDENNADRGSIKLRRLGSATGVPVEPQNPHNVRSMLDVDDNTERDTEAADFATAENTAQKERPGRFSRMRHLGRRPRAGSDGRDQLALQNEYDASIVDMLDVVDPEVSALNTMTNVQNSLFIPSLGRFVNRRPTYNLSRVPFMPGAFPHGSRENVRSHTPDYPASIAPTEATETDIGTPATEEPPSRPTVERIPSTMTERFFAVRPHNTSLADWSDEDLAQLDDHVRHMLHSKRSAFKRRMKAFGQYIRKPLGFFVTLYATLITLFGLAWVLFLIGWIYVGEKQLYIINIIDNVLVALFAIMGDGLIPWRLVDTYHMCFIARYHHLTWKLRDKMAVPDLKDKNDLPSVPVVSDREEQRDLEAQRDNHFKEEQYSVLTPAQQTKLEHHQHKFANSHTFYKPHETETHFAFPLRLLVAIVVLLDCHSCFQISLGLCTWLIDYKTRPGALTATILCCSIAVNTTAGILITVGDRKTRKKDVVERMFRQELTEEAMRRMRDEKEKEEERERENAENPLQSIQEEERIWPLPKPKLDFLHRNSEDNKGKSRKSADLPRKSLDQAGRFNTSVHPHGIRSDTDLRMAGAFPEAKEEEEE